MEGTFGSTVEALFKCYKISVGDGYKNPCRVINVVLADDDVFCNATTTKIIEASGQYRVFPFYNGNAVLILAFSFTQ